MGLGYVRLMDVGIVGIGIPCNLAGEGADTW